MMQSYGDKSHSQLISRIRELETREAELKMQIARLNVHPVASGQQAMEQALRESENRLKLLVQNLNAGVVVHAPDTQILLANKQASKLLGLSLDQMMGKKAIDPAWTFIHEDESPMPLDEYPVTRIFARREAIRDLVLGIQRPVTKDCVWVVVNGFPDFEPDGTLKQVVVTFFDITELKKAEKENKKNEEKYRNIFDNVQDVYYETSIDGTILDVSPSIEILTKGQYRSTDLIGKSIFNFYANEKERDQLLKALQAAGSVTDFELSLLNRDRSVTPCTISSKLTFNDAGNPYKIIGSLHDITIRKQNEKILRESEQLYHAMFEKSPAVKLIIDPATGNITDANKAACLFYGYPPDQLRKMNIHEINLGTPDEIKIKMYEVISDKCNYFQFKHVTKNGEIRDVEVYSSPIEINGKIHLNSIIHDITERKVQEEELLKAKEKAEESDRLKSSFLANMSHEIRTPMNGILGFTELLKEPQLTGEEQEKYISIIEKSGYRLLNIINDIISLSKLESGYTELTLTETNINDQIEYINTFFRPEADQKGIQLLFKERLTDGDAIIRTDQEKIYAILTNLVKNAIKFTIKGSIETGCVRKGGYLEFFVKDTGVGIPEALSEIVFKRFMQGSDSLTRNYEGAGLGLSISKGFVELMGGRIWIESEEGKGSTFFFTIPHSRK